MADCLKTRIYNVLEEILREKELDSVTVKELVERCHISRQGFYYHFHDIFDVLAWQMSRETARIMREGLRASSIEEPLTLLVKTLKEHFSVIKNALSSTKMRDTLHRRLVDALQTHMRLLLRRYARPGSLRPGQEELLLIFLAYGLTGLVLEKADGEDEAAFDPGAIARDLKFFLDAILTKK